MGRVLGLQAYRAGVAFEKAFDRHVLAEPKHPDLAVVDLAGCFHAQQVAVEVSSIIRASPDSFRVAWTERHYENGQLSTTERWTAILTIVIQPPRDAERLRANPLGIYVNAINWSREMSQ